MDFVRNLGVLLQNRIEPPLVKPNDCGKLQRLYSPPGPDATRDGVFCEHHGAGGLAVHDIEEGGISAAVRSQVDVGKPNLIPAAVTVDSQIAYPSCKPSPSASSPAKATRPSRDACAVGSA
jgi:hypothetical protein